MAHYNHKAVYPFQAASPIGQFKPVGVASGGKVLPVTAITGRIDGFTIATSPSALSDCAVVNVGQVKAISAGTIFAGDIVGIGSTNGALQTITALGLPTAGTGIRYSAGVALTAAVAGQTFTILLNAQQIV